MGVFQQGLSGLNTSQKNLEVIANNVSNANTVGFKGSAALFGDVFAATLGTGGSSSLSVGSGSQLNAVRQQFKQGNVQSTGNPLDLAINGDGFFKVKTDKGQEIYTRNGQFTLNKEGEVVNSDGNKLMAFPLDNASGRPLDIAQPLRVNQDQLTPKVTSEAKIRFNLDSRIEPAQGVFDPKNLETYSFSTNQVVYDQLGEPKNLSVYWKKTDTEGEWQVYSLLEGEEVIATGSNNTSGPFVTLRFDPDGKLVQDSAKFELNLGALDDSFVTEESGGRMTIDMSKSTQFGSGFNIQDLSQNGYDASSYAGFTIDETGRMAINYANGQSTAVGKIGLFRFKNPEGLQPIGNNGWLATLQAGSEIVSTSDDNAFGLIQSGAVEEANIDLTAELVAMISAQRVYQANSQSIKTQDSLLQTVTNLR